MQADYGYTISEDQSGKTFTVAKNRKSARTAQITLLAFGGVMSGICFAIAGAFAVFMLIVIVVGAIWGLIFALRSSGTTFMLGKEALIAGGNTYHKRDIRNLCIWEPGGVQVYASNLATAAGQAAVVNAVHAESLAITFDYGRDKVWLCKFLTEPQANAVAGDIQAWLTA